MPDIALLGPMMDSVQAQLRRLGTPIPHDQLAALPQARRDAITCAVTSAVNGAPPALLDLLPNLTRIVSAGAGRDRFDQDDLDRRGIALCDTGALVSSDTADMAIALLYALARDLVHADAHVRSGTWAQAHFGHRTRVAGKTVGVVGLGRIGWLIATRLAGAGLKPIYHTRTPRPDAPWPHEPDLATLAERSDFLIIAVPGGAATTGLIDATILRALGPNGALINISRGSVIDEEALIEALTCGTIKAAALDVFRDEPTPDARFATLPNTILTPHIAAITEDFATELAAEIARLVAEALSRPTHAATPRATPALVAHCDWSMDPNKRQMATALRKADHWHITAPEPVGPTQDLLPRLQARAPGALFLGFDFPIGLPAAYGARTGLSDFPAALRAFGTPPWEHWFDVCETPAQISQRRPFYPKRPGGTKRDHLLSGLALPGPAALLRACEAATPDRPAACALFWTLGGNQVGKGAITGWREVLQPNLAQLSLWPFHGPLHTLLRSGITVAETYPGEVYGQIGLPRTPRWSKRAQTGRASVAGPILSHIIRRGHTLAPGLQDSITDGFGPKPSGEDPFDALIGLLGMLDVLDGHRPSGAPDTSRVAQWEGWILGQSAPPSTLSSETPSTLPSARPSTLPS
jgi:hydroxypyruvate reductase